MIKTIETRDGEVSRLPCPLALVGAMGCVWGAGSQVFSTNHAWVSPCVKERGFLLFWEGVGHGWLWLHFPAGTGLDWVSLPP